MTINVLVKILARFLILILLQIFLFNNIKVTELGITPYFYIIFILLLPFEIPGWLLLVFGFVTGIVVDMFTDTHGIHAGATVLAAFIRPSLLKIISVREGYSPETSPVVMHYGFTWFLKYASVMIACHHFIFFLLLQFSFKGFFHMFPQYLLTTLFTLILIIISQFLIFRK